MTDSAVKKDLDEMFQCYETMQVALVELDNLEAKFRRGEIVSEAYLVARKKLVTDFYEAKDKIVEVVPAIAEKVPEPEEEGKLLRFRDFFRDNKQFVSMGLEFALEVMKVFSK